MTREIVVVFDSLEGGDIPWVERRFKPDALREDLGRLGVSTRSFVGNLEEAPDAWAYLLFTQRDKLDARRPSQPSLQQRLARTLGTADVPQRAAALADTLGLLGVVTPMGAWFTAKRDDPKATNSLFVKRSVASQLAWDVYEINSSDHYASTRGIVMPLPKLIVAYLTATLPELPT